MKRDECLDLQWLLISLDTVRASIYLRNDGTPAVRGRVNEDQVQGLKLYREVIVRHLSMGHVLDRSETMMPSDGDEVVEFLNDKGYGGYCPGDKIPKDFVRWRYLGTRIWWHGNGEWWLEPVRED